MPLALAGTTQQRVDCLLMLPLVLPNHHQVTMKKASLVALLVALVSCAQSTTVQAPNLSAQPDRANAVKAAYVKSYK